jgi:hypothetical protein
MSKTIRVAVVTLSVALVGVVGCGKKGTDNPEATATTAAPPPPAAPATGTVATYPNMTPQGGTVRLLQPFVVHQAASNDSPVLSHVGVGTWVNLKASFSNWMMIEWPSGVGQVSPGWIELRDVGDPRVSRSAPDAGAPPAVTIAPSSSARPPIRIIPKGH